MPDLSLYTFSDYISSFLAVNYNNIFLYSCNYKGAEFDITIYTLFLRVRRAIIAPLCKSKSCLFLFCFIELLHLLLQRTYLSRATLYV